MKANVLLIVAMIGGGCILEPPVSNNGGGPDQSTLKSCERWEVRWSDETIDASILQTTATVEAHIGPASPDTVYIVGGTRPSTEQPIAQSRIFRSVEGNAFELLVEESEQNPLHAIRCDDGECWFGGSRQRLGVLRDGEVIAATHDANGNFTVLSIASAEGIVAAFAEHGLFVSSTSFPDTFSFSPYEDGTHGTLGACGARECVAVLVTRPETETDTYHLSLARVDAASREVTHVVPEMLPVCERSNCGLQQIAVTEAGWFLAYENGLLYQSTDAGVSWFVPEGPLGTPRGEWLELDFHGSTGAVMTETELFFSVDAGKTFAAVPAKELLQEIAFADERSGVGLAATTARRFEIVCLD